MKRIFFSILFLSSLHLSAQTLADFYKKERIGVGLAVSYLNIPGYDYDNNFSKSYFNPIFTLDLRYQKPSKGGIYLQYKNLLTSDILTDLIIYKGSDDGPAGYRNITSGFFGRLSIGKNFIFNIEKGTAFSAGLVIGDSHLGLGYSSYSRANHFHFTPGIFLSYDKIICDSYKLRIYGEAGQSLTNYMYWAWEETIFRDVFPGIASVLVELNNINGFFSTLEINTVFNAKKDYSDYPIPIVIPNDPLPVRIKLGAGYRFNF